MDTERDLLRLRLAVVGGSSLSIRLEGGDGTPLGERNVEWTGTQPWYRLTSDRKAIHELLAIDDEGDGDPLAGPGKVLWQDILGDELGRFVKEPLDAGRAMLLEILCPREDPRLLTVPWQLLHDGDDYVHRRGLAVSARFDVEDPRLQPVSGPLKVLILFSSPGDAEVPPVDAEMSSLEKMYRGLPQHIRVTTLAWGVSLDDITEAWRRSRGFHVVHFICPATEDTLLLEGDRGRSEPVLWKTLAHVVEEFPAPWLVTLGTGRWPRDPWRLDYRPERDGVPEKSGLYAFGQPLDWSEAVTSFAAMGVPAVLTFQLPLEAKAGRAVLERFCRGVLTGELTTGGAWRLALRAGAAEGREGGGEGRGDSPAPALVGNVDLQLRTLPDGPSLLPELRGRRGCDVGTFPEEPMGPELAGRYGTTSRFLRTVLTGRDHCALISGATGIGKTAFVVNALRLFADSVAAVRHTNLRPETTIESIYAGIAGFCRANDWPIGQPTRVQAAAQDPEARALTYGRFICDALRGRRAVLVFDDIERVLTHGEAGFQFRDPALGMALRHIIENLDGSGLWLVSAAVPWLLGEGLPKRLAHFNLTEPQPRTARELFERHPELAALDLETTRSVYQATRGLPGVVPSLALLAKHGKLMPVLSELVPRKLQCGDADEYRDYMYGLVLRQTIALLPEKAQQLLLFAAMAEKPERQYVAAAVGIEAEDGTVAELADLGLVERLRSVGKGQQRSDRGGSFLRANAAVAEAAVAMAPTIGLDPDQLRERMGAFHGLRALELGRAAAVENLPGDQRRACFEMRRASLMRAMSYFSRASRWEKAAEMAVRLAEYVPDEPLRAQLRQALERLGEEEGVPPADAVNVHTMLARLDEEDGFLERIPERYERAIGAARSAGQHLAALDVRAQFARYLFSHHRYDAADTQARAAADYAADINDPEREGRMRELIGLIAGRLDDHEEAARQFDRAGVLLLEAQRPRSAALAFLGRAESQLRIGRVNEAVRTLAHACASGELDDSVHARQVAQSAARIIGQDRFEAIWEEVQGD